MLCKIGSSALISSKASRGRCKGLHLSSHTFLAKSCFTGNALRDFGSFQNETSWEAAVDMFAKHHAGMDAEDWLLFHATVYGHRQEERLKRLWYGSERC